MVAERGDAPETVEAVALVHGGEPVGRLLLGVRAGERGFRPSELTLLHDLARQAGAAIHAQRLRDDLARSRERLVVAREEERRRLRRDLHDGLGPTLAAIGMRAEAAAATLDDGSGASHRQLEALNEEVRTALADVRRLVDGLRPPALDELGLVGAIGQQAARLDGGPDREPGVTSIRVESPSRAAAGAAGGGGGRRVPDHRRGDDQRRPPRGRAGCAGSVSRPTPSSRSRSPTTDTGCRPR